jgi:hypothetical protein
LARYHVGIDVGKTRHHACVHDTQADTYSKVFSFSVDRPGFQELLVFLESQASQEELLVGVEASGPYALTISYFLLEGGYQVVELNPYQASQFRKAQGKKAKTDRVDARSLATFLGVGSYKTLSLTDPLLENLRELTRFRADLIQDRTRQLNRLQENLALASQNWPPTGPPLAPQRCWPCWRPTQARRLWWPLENSSLACFQIHLAPSPMTHPDIIGVLAFLESARPPSPASGPLPVAHRSESGASSAPM